MCPTLATPLCIDVLACHKQMVGFQKCTGNAIRKREIAICMVSLFDEMLEENLCTDMARTGQFIG